MDEKKSLHKVLQNSRHYAVTYGLNTVPYIHLPPLEILCSCHFATFSPSRPGFWAEEWGRSLGPVRLHQEEKGGGGGGGGESSSGVEEISPIKGGAERGEPNGIGKTGLEHSVVGLGGEELGWLLAESLSFSVAQELLPAGSARPNRTRSDSTQECLPIDDRKRKRLRFFFWRGGVVNVVLLGSALYYSSSL